MDKEEIFKWKRNTLSKLKKVSFAFLTDDGRLLPTPYSLGIDGYFAVTSTLCFGIDFYAKTPRAPEVC
jgi:hypothetical protein